MNCTAARATRSSARASASTSDPEGPVAFSRCGTKPAAAADIGTIKDPGLESRGFETLFRETEVCKDFAVDAANGNWTGGNCSAEGAGLSRVKGVAECGTAPSARLVNGLQSSNG